MQKKQIATAALLAALMCSTAPAFADDAAARNDQTVVATVADQPIYQSQLDQAVAQFKGQFGNMPEEQLQAVALSSLIDMTLINDAAKAEGLDKTPEFAAQMKLMREQELYNEYYDEHIASEVTDDMVKARYDKEVAALPKQQEIHARQILVDNEDQAKDIIKQLDDGADFATLAEKYSTGPSAKTGGDLGYFTEGQMAPAFEKAAFALKPGQYTETPVKTDLGYHIIEVEDLRDKAPAPYDQVAPQVRQLVIRDQYVKELNTLKKDGTIVIEDKDLQSAYDDINKQNS